MGQEALELSVEDLELAREEVKRVAHLIYG